jgi:hypothetical protein
MNLIGRRAKKTSIQAVVKGLRRWLSVLLLNFQRIYRPLADSWAVYDNSGGPPRVLEKGR